MQLFFQHCSPLFLLAAVYFSQLPVTPLLFSLTLLKKKKKKNQIKACVFLKINEVP